MGKMFYSRARPQAVEGLRGPWTFQYLDDLGLNVPILVEHHYLQI